MSRWCSALFECKCRENKLRLCLREKRGKGGGELSLDFS